MRFLADECCDFGLVMSLRDAGHDVLYVLEEKAGVSDDEVLSDAFNEGFILLTEIRILESWFTGLKNHLMALF